MLWEGLSAPGDSLLFVRLHSESKGDGGYTNYYPVLGYPFEHLIHLNLNYNLATVYSEVYVERQNHSMFETTFIMYVGLGLVLTVSR